MNIEMSENASIASVIITIALCLTFLGANGCNNEYKLNRDAIKAGLVQVNDTAQSTHWTKP